MKYREDEIPPEMLAVNASNDMLVFTAIIGIAIGIVLFLLGRYGRQMWMWTWGAGLVVCSIIMWMVIGFGWILPGV